MSLQKNIHSLEKIFSGYHLPLLLALFFIGLSISGNLNRRQYTSEKVIKKDDDGRQDAGSEGMRKFFFNARKNPLTNKMDYPAMLASYKADLAMRNVKRTYNFSSSASLPDFNWNSLGPVGISGSVYTLLIDKNDPSGQTMFAGFVNGGIWKSTNGGATWGSTIPTLAFSQDDTMANLNICCLAQDVNGVLYAGTGDGHTAYSPDGSPYGAGVLGGGIFKSTDDGVTWTQLASTIPTPVDSWMVAWAYINQIAVQPANPNIIYAATSFGIYISHDGGLTWAPGVTSTNRKLWKSNAYNSSDIKISNDGGVVIAGIGGNTYLCYPATNDSLFIEAPITGAGHINGNASYLEYAISPTDPNRIYASEIAASGSFCQNKASGIYMCENAESSGNGGYWYDIGPGGTTVFDPYVEPASTDDQATYDNTLGVSPGNEGELLVGGTTVWKWVQANSSDTIGSWSSVSDYYNIGGNDPRYVGSDEHAIAFDPTNPDVVFVGGDGGVYKSIDNGVSWLAYNRNFAGAEFYSLCYAPNLFYVNVNVGNNLETEGIGMGGGTQDNGSLYMNGNGLIRDSATMLYGGDGAGCAVSQINPNYAYFCGDYGYLLRENSLPNLWTPQSAYTRTYGNCMGGDIDSMYNAAAASGGVNFVFPVALFENLYDTLNSDSVQFIATQNYNQGDTIYPIGINATYPYILPKALTLGDTITVPDRGVSKLAVAFSGPYGVWINGQGASQNPVIWKPIGGPLSKPDAFTTTEPPHCLAWAPNGDALFVGVEGGSANLYRFSNLNKVIANTYCSGALWYEAAAIVPTGDSTVISTNITFSAIAGADILSIDIDPKNGNNVLVTIGGYDGISVENVWYSTNALGAATFKSVQGNLPPMPVYSGLVNILDSTGKSIAGSAMLATEHGVYSTDNINASSVQWVKNNKGMANCLSFVLKQQTLPSWECNSTGIIYLATYGRGLWNATDLYPKIPDAIPMVKADLKKDNLAVYPNPMTSQGNISFNLAGNEPVTITIYNMQGRVIKELNLGMQGAGNHIVPMETADLPSGTYFASLTAPDIRKTSKFVVVK